MDSNDTEAEGNEPMDILESISGVGKREAEALHKVGYHTHTGLRNASQAEIAVVDGIGNALAARIKADVGGLDVRDSRGLHPGVKCDSLRQKNIQMEGGDVVVGENMDEITLKRDGEEKTVDVDELFDDDDSGCGCESDGECNDCTSESPTFGSGRVVTVELACTERDYFGTPYIKVLDLEVGDVDVESVVEELEETDKNRQVCSHQYCENWADECTKHGDSL